MCLDRHWQIYKFRLSDCWQKCFAGQQKLEVIIAGQSAESSEGTPKAAKADQTTEVATDKADHAESPKATPEAAKADQTNQDNAEKYVVRSDPNVDNAAESSEAIPEAAKADQTTQDNAANSAESSEATPEAAKAYQTPPDNADKSVEPSEGNPEAAKFSALLTIFRFAVFDTTVVHQP